MTQPDRTPAKLAPHSRAGLANQRQRSTRLTRLALAFALIGALLAPQSTRAVADELPDAAAETIAKIIQLTRDTSTAVTETIEQRQSPSITIAATGGAFIDPGTGATINVTFANPSSQTLAASRSEIRLANQPFATLSQLHSWIAPESTQNLNNQNSSYLTQVTAPQIESGSEYIAPFTIPATTLATMSPGVYAIEAREASGALKAHGTLTIRPNSIGSINISVVVPITAPPQSTGLLSYARLNELTGPGGQLKDALDAVRGTNAVIAVDPAIPAAIRVLGADAPSNATAWLDQLESMPNERFPLQFGDADVSAQFQLGMQHPLGIDSLAAYESSSAQEAGLNIAQLSSIDNAALPASTISTPIYLPYQAGMSTEVYEALARSRTAGVAPLTLLSSEALLSQTHQARITANNASLISYDQPLSLLLQEAFEADTGTELDLRLSNIAAELSLKAELGPKSLVLLSERGAQLKQAAVRSTLITLGRQSPGTLAPLSTIISESPEEAEAASYPAIEERADFVSEQLVQEPIIAEFATVIPDPTLITSANRAELLQLLGVGWMSPIIRPTWAEATEAHEARIENLLNSVELLPPVHSALLSSEATLQYWVRNDLPYEIKLVLEANPENSRLAVTQFTKFSAAPRSKSAVLIPVNTRLSSGETDVALILRSEANVPIGPSRIASVYVQAEEEGLISFILIGISTLLIAAGIWRTISRRRKAKLELAGVTTAGDSPKPDSGVSE